MKTLLAAILVLQIAVPTTLFAQSTPSGGMQSPNTFWSGDSQVNVNPSTTNPKFGDVPNDPWNIGGDTGTTWGNTWGNGQTGEPNIYTDPTNLGWGSTMSYGSYYGDPAAVVLQSLGVLNKPYNKMIFDLRDQTSFQKDDELAQEIINNAVKGAAVSGAISSLVYSMAIAAIPKLNPAGNMGGWGSGIGLGAAGVIDYAAVLYNQSTMILKLAALYGCLPSDPQERVELLQSAYAFASLIDAGAKAIQGFLKSMIEKSLGVEAGAAAQAGQAMLTAEILKGVVSNGASKALAAGEVLSKAVADGVKPAAANEVTLYVANEAIANGIVKQATQDGLQVSLSKVAGATGVWATIKAAATSTASKKLAAWSIAAGVGAGISVLANTYSTKHLAKNMKEFFKATKLIREARAIERVKTNPLIRKTLWMILTRDVFKRIPGTENQTKFAQVVATEVPLLQNQWINEKDEVASEFRSDTQVICDKSKTTQLVKSNVKKITSKEDVKNVKVTNNKENVILSQATSDETNCKPEDQKVVSIAIDKNLIAIGKSLHINTDAKLYMMKLIMAGMYMKGTLSAADYESLNSVAVMLNLQAPINVQVSANDIRLDYIGKFLTLMAEMDRSTYYRNIYVSRAQSIKSSSNEDNKSTLEKIENYGPGGSIILEDFERQAPVMRELEKSFSNKGVSTDTMKKISEIADKEAEKIIKDKQK